MRLGNRCTHFGRADVLSNKIAYPTFVRTVPPKPLYKHAIARLMEWAEWKKAMLLTSNAESYLGLAKAFRAMCDPATVGTACVSCAHFLTPFVSKQLQALAINVTLTYFYEFEQTSLDENDLHDHVLESMQKLRTRIVIVLGYSRNLKRIALQALDAGMIVSGWVWIGTSDVQDAERSLLGAVKDDQRLADAQLAFSGWLFFNVDTPSSPVSRCTTHCTTSRAAACSSAASCERM
jgi:hypothetical protein